MYFKGKSLVLTAEERVKKILKKRPVTVTILSIAGILKNICGHVESCPSEHLMREDGRNKYTRFKRTVQFDDNVHTILIPFEDRKGECMNYAIDRAHFKRRIHQMEMILLPILKKKLAESFALYVRCTMSRYGCILLIKDVDAIVHQCNCLTVKSHGLSQKISECFLQSPHTCQR